MQSRVNNSNLYGENLKYGTYTEQTVPGGSLLRGEVVDNNDPLSMGRVKVMIPSIYYGMPNEELPWAPVLQQGAGAGAGSMIIPEVGTIAVCSFEGGRYDKPIVVGTVYGTGSSSPLQVGNSIHCQNAQGDLGTTNYRTIENPETPVQGQNLNTPVLYKSHNGSYIQFDNTTGEDDINLVGHSGDYCRIGNKRIALETSSGEETGAHMYSGSHLFMNDHSSEYFEEKGQQVELASKGGFFANMNDKLKQFRLFNKKKTQYIEITQEKDMTMRWYDKKLREIKLGADGVKLTNSDNVFSMEDKGVYIHVGENDISVTQISVVIDTPGARITCSNGKVLVEADSMIDLQAPVINLGD